MEKGIRQKADYYSYTSLNHMFIEGEGKCLPAEYGVRGNVPEYVINDIAEWISSQ